MKISNPFNRIGANTIEKIIDYTETTSYKINVTSNNFTYTFKINGYDNQINYIDWGDGNVDELIGTATLVSVSHVYQTSGEYIVAITGKHYNVQTTNNSVSFTTLITEAISLSKHITSGDHMFYYSYDLATIRDTFILNDNIITCRSMFKNNLKLSGNISIILSKFTKKQRTLVEMFYGCKKLSGIAPAQILWENEKITSYSGCFTDCESLENYGIIPRSWGGGHVEIKDQSFIANEASETLKLSAIGYGNIEFFTDQNISPFILSKDGTISNLIQQGTYGLTVKCRNTAGSEDEAAISIIIDYSLNKLDYKTSKSEYEVSQSSDNNAYNTAYNAIDGNINSYSQTSFDSSNDGWWQTKFNIGPVILKYIQGTMQAYNESQLLYLEASNDGQNFVNVTSFAGGKVAIQTNLKIPYQYYRIKNLKNGYFIRINQVEFYYNFAENFLFAKDQASKFKMNEENEYQIEYMNLSETPASFSILQGTLPIGVILDTTTGKLYGNPTQQSETNLKIQITNTFNTIEINFNLIVVDATKAADPIISDGLRYFHQFIASPLEPQLGNKMTLAGNTTSISTINGINCIQLNENVRIYDENANYWTISNAVSTVTLSFWVNVIEKSSDNLGRSVVLGENRGLSQGMSIAFCIQPNNFGMEFAGHFTTNCGAYQINKWYHIVMKTSNNTMYSYVNNVLKGSGSRSYKQMAQHFLGFNCYKDGGQYTPGIFQSKTKYYIASIRLYDRALSDEEIQQLYLEHA